ncbi:glutathione S-transferase [Infundibulicybe gibba]|nr:glutathione S-transferase [Infundibulicybe gibba]
MDSGKHYHNQCTGNALKTANEHTADEDITLFGSCFSPPVQRVWVALEYLGIPYKYCETDPHKKSKDLLEVSPKGLIPALKLHYCSSPRALNESTVIMDYLQDLASVTTKRTLLPSDPYARALVRLQSDFVNRNIVPTFYRYIQAQDADSQVKYGKEFHQALGGLVTLLERAENEIANVGGTSGEGKKRSLEVGLGLWLKDGDLGWTDVMVGPWLFRATNVLRHYRGFEMPTEKKFSEWIERLFNHPAFKATCSTDDLYIDSNERYAFNRANSQIANAINSGRNLP